MSNSKRSKSRRSDLTEENVINYLSEYFVIFESNLRDNNFFKMNTLIPELIVDKFGKLFELWNENLVLAKSIQEKRFKDVYSLMSNAFDDSSSDSNSASSVNSLILECKHCGENVAWRNNDCRYSYNCHKTSPEHLELMKKLNLDEDSSKSHTSDDSSEDDEVGKFDQFFIYSRCNLCYIPLPIAVVDMNSVQEKNFVTNVVVSHLRGPIHRQRIKTFRNNEMYVQLINFKENLFKCLVCDEKLYLDKMIQHCKSDEHKMKIADYEYKEADETRLLDEFVEGTNFLKKYVPKLKEKGGENETIFMREFDKECLVFADGTIRCRLCFCKLITSFCLITHMNGANHQKEVKKLGVSVHHVKRIDEDNLRCTVCNINKSTLGMIVKHCKKAAHLQKLKKLLDDGQSMKEVDESLVDVSTTKYKCPICLNFVVGAKGLYVHFHTKHPYVCLE